jgi:uncharacterized repeat protein (TIGR01451 family)
MAVVVLGGAAVTGRAATTQQVTASLTCQPATVNPKPGSTIGCTMTVANAGGNIVNQVVVTDLASGGTFLSSSSSLCTPSGSTLTCNIGKLTGTGTPGSTFSETHELDVPDSGASVTQTVTGRYSPNPNSRGSDTIPSVSVPTTLDTSNDFDGKFANGNGESVQTGTTITSDGNPYSTGATLLGTTGFAVGLSVREQSAGASNVNCPGGCFGGQVIEFNITPLATSALPTSFRLTIRVYVGPGVKSEDIQVYHNGFAVPEAPDTDPAGDSLTGPPVVDSSTKIATVVIEGPGTGNGSWGVI